MNKTLLMILKCYLFLVFWIRTRVEWQKWSRLESFEAASQEWHKTDIILTDTYELLYKPSSARESGIFYNIRNTFKHKNIKKNIMHCVNHAVDLLNFTIIDAACHFMSCKEISEQVTELAFHPVDDIVNEDEDVKCDICKLDSDGDWIQCEFINCNKWFHLNYYGLFVDKVPEGEWFCSEMCKTKKNSIVNITETDSILEYTKAVMWRGIGHMVHSDAAHENDGLRMMLHWRYDMVDFYQHHHPKYFIFGFCLLTNINGGICERLKQDLIWNRTVNTSGGPGKNIAMDLQMEHFNNEYKTCVKSAGGQLTDATIARHSQMIGIRKELCKCFDEQIACRKSDYMKSGSIKQDEDIEELVSTLLVNNVFSCNKSRSYHGFEHFHLSTSLKNEEAFNKRIQKHKSY